MEMEAVIFDMDGVIFDSERLCMKCWHVVAEKYNIPDIDEVIFKCIGTNKIMTTKIVTEHYGKDFDFKKYEGEMSTLFHEYEEKHSLPKKVGVVELLDYLKAKNYKLAVASSTRIALVTKQLEHAGLLHYFDEVVGGDMLEKSKPAPDIYLMACEKIQVKPEKAYAIEDSYNGIRSANAAGMKAIMVPDMLPADDEMREKSIMIRNSLLELIDEL